jgi:hypothetical protein
METTMLKKVALAVCVGAFCSSAAVAAEYYVVQEQGTRKCKVVDARPTETTWVQIGPLAFKTREEADRQLTVICKEKN